jgi:hypothetical protein
MAVPMTLIREEYVFSFMNSAEVKIEKIQNSKGKTIYFNSYYYGGKMVDETNEFFNLGRNFMIYRNFKNAKSEAMETIKKIVEKLEV